MTPTNGVEIFRISAYRGADTNYGKRMCQFMN